MSKNKYYDIKPILKTNADYYVIFGERSNGKSFGVEEIMLFGLHEDGIDFDGYLDKGKQSAIIRRWDEDLKGSKGANVWNHFIYHEKFGNILEKRTKGEWNNIIYLNRAWWLELRDENGNTLKRDVTPFCYAFAISSEEHYKSVSFPKIYNILLDEFISRSYYLPDEFILFTSILSTIIRTKDEVKIFMCGNTIGKYNPYFSEMGLKNAKNQKSGTIDVYTYGESSLRVAVEHTEEMEKRVKKESNKYFAFDNPKLKMISKGEWELNLYPHIPFKYFKTDIRYIYFIVFDSETFQCEIIEKNDNYITYIHRKTTPIKEDERGMIYSQDFSYLPNHSRNILKPHTMLQKKILRFFARERVFYQDNEVGNTIESYINWCSNL